MATDASCKLGNHRSPRKHISFFIVALLLLLATSAFRLAGETTDGFNAYSLERLGEGTGVGINVVELASGRIEKAGAVSAYAETSAPDAVPTITGLSPDICAGGTIIITGTNLSSVQSIKIGDTQVPVLTSLITNTATQIVAIVNNSCKGKVSVTTYGGTATSTATFTATAIPPPPTVVSPVNYCLNQPALPLTATGLPGSSLIWGSGSSISGAAGGSDTLRGKFFIDTLYSNKKTIFNTTVPNVTIATIDYYVAPSNAVLNIQLAISNSSGTVIATSSTITTFDAPDKYGVKISNIFNYTIATAGTYSIGLVSPGPGIPSYGVVGGDTSHPYPITEPTGTINIVGVTPTKAPRCYNIQFTVDKNSTTVPTPPTSLADSTDYEVSQSVNGCISQPATIQVIVSPVSVGGTANSSATVCSGANSGTLKLTGNTGSVIRWESSTNGTSWTAIAETTTSHSYSNLTQTTQYRAVVQSGVCSSANSTAATITVGSSGQWSGTVSSDWNDSRNWFCGQIPTSTTDVQISAGTKFYPMLMSGYGQVKNINILSGSSVIVSGDGTLQIFGTIANSGVFDVSNGTIDMRGTSPQMIPARAFANNSIKNLIISNKSPNGLVGNFSGVKVFGNIDIYRSLTYGITGAILNTGGFITLKSNATQTAWMGNINGSTLTGAVTVERYVTALKDWQFLAVPTDSSQTIHQAWQEGQAPGVVGTVGFGTNITGPSGTGLDFISPNYSMKYWDNATGAYKMINNTNDSFPNKSNGFFLYIRGDRRATASDATPHEPTVLRSMGLLHTGRRPFLVATNAYYSIGNPYASKVDFGSITGMNSIGSIFYLWDPLINGSYGVGGYQTLSEANGYKPLIQTAFYNISVPCPYLESGQAAFVYNNSPSPVTLTFNESDKRDSSNLVNDVVVNSSSQFFRTYLSTASGIVADGNAVAFNKDYQDGIDINDAVKFFNTGENFSLKRNGVILSVEARSPVKASDTIYYDMEYVKAMNYQLQFKPENMPGDALIAFLVDNYLKTKTEISLKENSAVNFTVNSDAASFATNRFMVVFEESGALPVTFVSIKATEKDKNILVDWQVENEDNMQQYEVEKSTDGNNFEKVATIAAKNDRSENYQWMDENAASGYNYYRVRGVGKDNNSQYTTVAKVLMGDLKTAINVYPNPVTGEMIHLQFMNQPKGEYNTRLFNHLGQLVVAQKIEFAGGNGNADIHWNSNLSRGMYQLEVTKPDGTVVSIKIMY